MVFFQPPVFPLSLEAVPVPPHPRGEHQRQPDHDAPHCVRHIILFNLFSIYTSCQNTR
jgi:hypothetical protein